MTAGYQKTVNREMIESAFISAGMGDVIRVLQGGKLVLAQGKDMKLSNKLSRGHRN